MKRMLRARGRRSRCRASCAARARRTRIPRSTVTLIVPYAAGRAARHGRARRRPEALREMGPGGGDREQARRQRRGRRRSTSRPRPPDGYTLQVTDGTMFSVNPWIYKTLPYDPIKDFTFISLTARAPLFLAVNPSIPADDFPQFVKEVKAQSGQVQLRLVGHRQHPPPHHRVDEARARPRPAARAVQGHRAVGAGGRGEPGDAPSSRRIPSLAGFVKERQAEAHRGEHREALGARARRADVAENGDPGLRLRADHRLHGSRGHAAGARRTRSAATWPRCCATPR